LGLFTHLEEFKLTGKSTSNDLESLEYTIFYPIKGSDPNLEILIYDFIRVKKTMKPDNGKISARQMFSPELGNFT